MEILDVCTTYARRVVAGKVPAGRLMRRAAARFLEDLRRAQLKRPPRSFPWRWNEARAARVVRFIELLPHTKGDLGRVRARITLEPWQVFIVGNVFGWVHKDTGHRRFRWVYVEVPRKNGKSLLAAGIALYMLCADWEAGAEVYTAATTTDQAREVFDVARRQVRITPDLRSAFGLEHFQGSIIQMETGSKMQPLPGIPRDGSNPSCTIIDEYHQHPSNDVVEALEGGMNARSQPVSFKITTAGTDINGPCYAYRQDCVKILEGTAEDDRTFVVIYTVDLDEGIAWDSEEAIRMANPNLGVSVGLDDLLAELNRARRDPRVASHYKTKFLNIWVSSRDPFFDGIRWGKLAAPRLKVEELDPDEWRFFFGLDLAKKFDFTALLIVAENAAGEQRWTSRFWYPREVALERRDIPILQWEEAGDVKITPGEVLDQEFVKEDLRELASLLKPEAIAYDHWAASGLVTSLLDEGLPMVEVTLSVKSLSSSMYAMRDLILARKLKHDDNACMNWMVSNVVAKVDANDNVFPRKEAVMNQIDGPVAGMLALSLLLRSPRPPENTMKGVQFW